MKSFESRLKVKKVQFEMLVEKLIELGYDFKKTCENELSFALTFPFLQGQKAVNNLHQFPFVESVDFLTAIEKDDSFENDDVVLYFKQNADRLY